MTLFCDKNKKGMEMKVRNYLVSLVAVGFLVGCGGGGSDSSNGSSSSKNKQVVDITDGSSLISTIEIDTDSVYRLRQDDGSLQIRRFTVVNSATKECKVKVISLKADWHEDMDSRYQYGNVFEIKSSLDSSYDYFGTDSSIRFEDGVYILPYDHEDHGFVIQFMSGGSEKNFVDFSVFCEDKGE